MVDFNPCLFGVSKDDVGRCILNNSRYVCNTESGCININPLTIELVGAIGLAEMVALSFCSCGPLLKSPLDVVGDDDPNSPGFNSGFALNKPLLAADWSGFVPNKAPDWLVAGKELEIPVIVWFVELALLLKTLPVRPVETLFCPNRPDWLVTFPGPNKPDWLDVLVTVGKTLDWIRELLLEKLSPDWPNGALLPKNPLPAC